MTRTTRTSVRAVGTAAGLCAAAVFALWWVRRPVASPELRGYRIADRLGCFGCHGPGGTGGVPNPGSEEGEIPAWTGGTLMMYAKDDAELGGWIRHGSPKWSRTPGPPPVRMPGFGDVLSDGDLRDLVAYVNAVGGRDLPPAGPARDGYRVAARLGCFGCHGPAGRLGVPNPGSFKGVVPGWTGPDFRDLVRDEGELTSWILDGGIPRLNGHPVARWFMNRQAIRMPAFRTILKRGELESLRACIGRLGPR